MESGQSSSSQNPGADNSNIQRQRARQQSSSFARPSTSSRQRHVSFAPHTLGTGGSSEDARVGTHLPQVYGYPQIEYFDAIGEADPSRSHAYDHVSRDQVYSQEHQQDQRCRLAAQYNLTPLPVQHQEQVLRPSYGQPQHARSQPITKYETQSDPFTDPLATPYYAGAQPGPSTAMGAEYATQTRLQSEHQAHTNASHSPMTGLSTHGTMLDAMQQGIFQGYGQQHSIISSAPPALKQKQQEYAPFDENEFAQYQIKIRTVFAHVHDRTLRNVPELLCWASRYLMNAVHALGLAQDEAELHDEKIKFWTEFNRAWLTTMQCQFDMVQQVVAGEIMPAGQSTLDYSALDELSRELLKLCDRLQRLALVDYQMGVAESEIIDIILRCLDQLETLDEDATMAGAEQ